MGLWAPKSTRQAITAVRGILITLRPGSRGQSTMPGPPWRNHPCDYAWTGSMPGPLDQAWTSIWFYDTLEAWFEHRAGLRLYPGQGCFGDCYVIILGEFAALCFVAIIDS